MFARMRLAAVCAVAAFSGFAGVSSATAGGPPLPKDPMIKAPLLPPKIHHYHVEYRMPLPRTKTFTDHGLAHKFENKLKSLGFKTKLVHHVGHYHVTYELDFWRQKIFVGPAGHAQAHALQAWLQSIGAQTKLVHH